MELESEVLHAPRFPAVNEIDVASLRDCAALMGPIQRISFDGVYGNLRRLIQLEVQTSAIVALSRFYDSRIRCFLFKNFQLAPTLEEYGQILGLSGLDAPPYQYQKQYYSEKAFAEFLQVGVDDVKGQMVKRNKVWGFSQDYFEGLLKTFANEKNWDAFKPLLALTIFGIVLFPQIERHIDITVVGIFMAFIDQKNPINPVPAILADTYTALTHHYEHQRRKVSCSSHLLYAWLLTHVCLNKRQSEELIDYALTCEVGNMTIQEWIRTLGHLDEHDVRWFMPSCWKDRPNVVVSCGSFKKVPLMGTKGCVNYNPSLTLRQLGYPMKNAPTDEMLFKFYFFEGGSRDESLYRRVMQAWDRVIYNGKAELTKRTSDVPFTQWLQKRIQNTQLPYQKSLQANEEVTEPAPPVVEELGEVRLAWLKAEEEKRALQAELERVSQENKKLREESANKSFAIMETRDKLRKEEEDKLDALGGLRSARENVKRYKAEKKEALQEASRWRGLCETARDSDRRVQDLLNESLNAIDAWREQYRDLERERDAIEELLKGNQQALRFERMMTDDLKCRLRAYEEAYHRVNGESKYWMDKYVALIGWIEERKIVIDLQDEVQFWKDKFSRLSELSNQAAASVPRNLRKAEVEMNPLNTPPEVYKFIKSCRALLTEIKEKTQGPSTSRKRKKDEDFKALCI